SCAPLLRAAGPSDLEHVEPGVALAGEAGGGKVEGLEEAAKGTGKRDVVELAGDGQRGNGRINDGGEAAAGEKQVERRLGGRAGPAGPRRSAPRPRRGAAGAGTPAAVGRQRASLVILAAGSGRGPHSG